MNDHRPGPRALFCAALIAALNAALGIMLAINGRPFAFACFACAILGVGIVSRELQR